MDVVYKGGSLLYTQLSTAARCALLLPRYVLANVLSSSSTAAAEPHPGATFYEGKVIHSRRQPVHNSFEYPVRMVVVDLQQPPPWFVQAQAADHLSLQEARAFAQTDGGVLLLTNPVVGGYVQNPISVYYCFDSSSGKLAKCIAEVTNTPWGERVSFVFDPSGAVSPKALHVSPFMDMDNTWHLTATGPGPKMGVSVAVSHPTLGNYFEAHLLLRQCPPEQQRPAEQAGLATLWRYGFMPQRVAFWIYWQAVKLIAKGCPIYTKPGPEFQQRVSSSSSSSIKDSGAGCPYVWREAQQWPWFL